MKISVRLALSSIHHFAVENALQKNRPGTSNSWIGCNLVIFHDSKSGETDGLLMDIEVSSIMCGANLAKQAVVYLMFH